MKRLLPILLAAVLIMMFSSCNKEDDVYMPETGKVQIFQLAPEHSSLMMSYVIKTPNNKIVVFDGGRDGEGLSAEPYILSAIRAILGIDEKDYFEIEAWFLTHEHRDHYYELAKCLQSYSKYSTYKINNFYFDFPDIGTEWNSAAGENDYTNTELNLLKKGFKYYFEANGETLPEGEKSNYYYNKINGAVINQEAVGNGLKIEIDGLTFNILQTWEQQDNNVNSTSVVTRITYGEHSMLILGDEYADSGDRLVKKYGGEALKSEYVQMAHHGQSACNQAFYNAIDAKNSIRLWPTPWWVWDVTDRPSLHTDSTRSWLGLPENASEVTTIGETDFVAGMYDLYPEDPTKVESWTKNVLENMKVAVW